MIKDGLQGGVTAAATATLTQLMPDALNGSAENITSSDTGGIETDYVKREPSADESESGSLYIIEEERYFTVKVGAF